MKNTWRHLFRRLAAGCAISGSVAWSSALCYAQQIAFDSADDPIYADGWQEGDDGGTGFGPWSFDGTSHCAVPGCAYDTAPSHQVDDGLMAGTQSSSIHNNIGRAWTMYNYNGRSQGPSNPPQGSTDITRAGRALSTPLQVGQTVSVIIDNPIEQAFWRGYNVKLNSGGANVCYAGATCTPGKTPVNRAGVGTFENNTFGRWGGTTLYDYHTDSGVQIDFTLTDADSYMLSMTPLDNPGMAFEVEWDLEPGGPIDWIEFQFYNTDSDFYPTMVTGPQATDYYIRSIEVTSPDAPGVPGDYNDNGVVDAADYVILRKHLGTSFQLENEVSGVTPGMVTQADYNEWVARFGNNSGAGGGSGLAQAAVPEPSTFVYLVFAAACFVVWGLRRRSPILVAETCAAPVSRT